MQAAGKFSLRRFRSVSAAFLNHANERASLNLSHHNSKENEPLSSILGLFSPAIVFRSGQFASVSADECNFRAERDPGLNVNDDTQITSTVCRHNRPISDCGPDTGLVLWGLSTWASSPRKLVKNAPAMQAAVSIRSFSTLRFPRGHPSCRSELQLRSSGDVLLT